MAKVEFKKDPNRGVKEKAYKMAKDASKATMFFVSKLDADCRMF